MSLEPPMDAEIRERVTDLLYELLPAFYRVQDMPPQGQGELRRFLHVLAAPLALVRQSVEALHADLFIDSCGEDMLPALAEMLGTSLLFIDPAPNRRDLRSTSAWRRRKGSVRTLEALAGELLDVPVTTREGWQRLLVTQHLNLLRPERALPDMRNRLLAELASGPHEALFRTVDVRPASESTQRYDPRAVLHWTHPTRYFPLRQSQARRVSEPFPLYALHPLGARQPARADLREGEVRSDRVLPEHFAAWPGRYFAREEGFTVRLCGLPAALAPQATALRQASAVQADPILVRSGASLRLLEREERGWHGAIQLEAVALYLRQVGTPPWWEPDATSVSNMGELLLEGGEATARMRRNEAPLTVMAGVPWVPMLRLTALSREETWFPGATVEVVGWDDQATRASLEPELARAGCLRGALVVKLPGMWLPGDGEARWLHLAADGSVYPGGEETNLAALEKREDGGFLIPGAPLEVGPGGAWPATPLEASDAPLTLLPPSPMMGPVLMHGGQALTPSLIPVEEDTPVALAFAAVDTSQGATRYLPLLRLEWQGSGWLEGATWQPLGDDGQPVEDSWERFTQVAKLARETSAGLRLVVRLEGNSQGLVLTPCEVAWTPAEGVPLLLYLPELSTTAPPTAAWSSSHTRVGPPVLLHKDGSSRWQATGEVARYAHGPVAPLATGPGPSRQAALIRRRLRGRALWPWVEEPREGYLDMDTTRGLFAHADTEPAQAYPERLGASKPLELPAWTVDMQEGCTAHLGARPAPREPLLREPLPRPTRRIGRGAMSLREDSAPVYSSLTEALEAVARAPVGPREVLQFEDSATYEEWVTWQGMRAVPEGLEVVVQAAEGQRPVLEARSFSEGDGTRYRRLTLRGLCLAGAAVPLPAEEVELQLCTVEPPLVVGSSLEQGAPAKARVWRCLTSRLELRGGGVLRVEDSVVDGLGGEALAVASGRCELERVTVLGPTRARVLEASETLFDGPVVVEDRFQGCIRYSRVPEEPPSLLPRRHRCVEGVETRLVSRDRHHPGYARLAAETDARVLRGAEDGSELGAFHDVRLAQQYEALQKRLEEYTPAGLSTRVLRLD